MVIGDSVFGIRGLHKSSWTTNSAHRTELTVLVCIVIGLELVSVISANTTRLTAFWSAIQPHEQPYTALAFNDPNSLPTYLPASGEVAFSFTVHNNEGRSLSYPYIISAATARGTQNFSEKTVTLAPNAEATVAEKLKLAPTSSSQIITVALPDQQESIDFALQGTSS